MLKGGLLPFPRTGSVLYAKAILAHCSEIRQAPRVADAGVWPSILPTSYMYPNNGGKTITTIAAHTA